MLSLVRRCDMRRASTGHPRPWLCGHCGAELEDTAEALFPAALLASRQWRQRPDLQLTQMVLNLGRCAVRCLACRAKGLHEHACNAGTM